MKNKGVLIGALLTLLLLGNTVDARYYDPQYMWLSGAPTGTGGKMYRIPYNTHYQTGDITFDNEYLSDYTLFDYGAANHIYPTMDYVFYPQLDKRVNKSDLGSDTYSIDVYGNGVKDGHIYGLTAGSVGVLSKYHIDTRNNVWNSTPLNTCVSVTSQNFKDSLAFDDTYVYVKCGGTGTDGVVKIRQSDGVIVLQTNTTSGLTEDRIEMQYGSIDIDQNYAYLTYTLGGLVMLGSTPIDNLSFIADDWNITAHMPAGVVGVHYGVQVLENFVYLAIDSDTNKNVTVFKLNKQLEQVANITVGKNIDTMHAFTNDNYNLYLGLGSTSFEEGGVYVLNTNLEVTDHLKATHGYGIGRMEYKGGTSPGQVLSDTYFLGLIDNSFMQADCLFPSGIRCDLYDIEGLDAQYMDTIQSICGLIEYNNLVNGDYKFICELDSDKYPTIQTDRTPYVYELNFTIYNQDVYNSYSWLTQAYCSNETEDAPDYLLYGWITLENGSDLNGGFVQTDGTSYGVYGLEAGTNFYNITLQGGVYDLEYFNYGGTYATQYRNGLVLSEDRELNWTVTNWSIQYQANDLYGEPVPNALINFYHGAFLDATLSTNSTGGGRILLQQGIGYNYQACANKEGYVEEGVNCIEIDTLYAPRNVTQTMYQESTAPLHNFTVHIVEGTFNIPLESAYIKAYDSTDALLRTGFTNATGEITFELNEIPLIVKAYIEGYKTDEGYCGYGCEQFTNNLDNRLIEIEMYTDSTQGKGLCHVGGYITLNGDPMDQGFADLLLSCAVADGSGFTNQKVPITNGDYYADTLDMALCTLEYELDGDTHGIKVFQPISGLSSQYGGACAYCNCSFNASLTYYPEHTIRVYGTGHTNLDRAEIRIENSTDYIETLHHADYDHYYRYRFKTGESYTLTVSAGGYYDQEYSFTATEYGTEHWINMFQENESCMLAILFISDTTFTGEDGDPSLKYTVKNLHSGDLIDDGSLTDRDVEDGQDYFQVADIHVPCGSKFEVLIDSSYYEGETQEYAMNQRSREVNYNMEARAETKETENRRYIGKQFWDIVPWLYWLFIINLVVFFGGNALKMFGKI